MLAALKSSLKCASLRSAQALEIINPKKAAKIKDRQERFQLSLDRKKALDDKRVANLKAIDDRRLAEQRKIEAYEAKQRVLDDEVQEIVKEDLDRRGGVMGVLSGARWSARPNEDEIKAMLIEREQQYLLAKKMDKKAAKKELQEATKRKEEEEARARRKREREMSGSSGSDSDLSA